MEEPKLWKTRSEAIIGADDTSKHFGVAERFVTT